MRKNGLVPLNRLTNQRGGNGQWFYIAKINPLFDGVTTEQAYHIIDSLKDYEYQ